VWKAAQGRNAEEFSKLVPLNAVMIFQSGIVRQPEYLATMKARTVSHSEIQEMHGFMPNARRQPCALALADTGGWQKAGDCAAAKWRQCALEVRSGGLKRPVSARSGWSSFQNQQVRIFL
jgi:hypothetical protein